MGSVYECNKKSRFLSGLNQPIMSFIGNFSYVAVCVVGALLTMNGQISFGVIVAFMVYVRLFTGPLSQIAQGMTNLQSTAAASERVVEFLKEPEMDDQKEIVKYLDPAKVEGNIVFDHIKFSYDGEKNVIKDFCCDVKKGEKVGEISIYYNNKLVNKIDATVDEELKFSIVKWAKMNKEPIIILCIILVIIVIANRALKKENNRKK